jgi:beta-galactosidase
MQETGAGRRPLDDFGPRSWARPEVTGVGRLPMAAPLRRPDVVDLDGRWAFRLVDRPEAVTVEDLTGPTEGWAAVEVPGCWTMQDVGDRPHYTNLQMPFPGPPPHVPEANPTGVHRCTLDLPASWRDQRIVLHVGAAESVLYVHVDGRPVGMGKDSRLPQEYDLTALVEPGVPAELALTVVRWSDGTYLEDQDHWHHAGLHRSVRCYATPAVHLADLQLTADLDPRTGTGRLDLRVQVGVPAGERPKGWRVRATIAARSAEAEVHVEHPTEPHVNWMVFEGRGARLSMELPGVAPWTAETPALHDLTVVLLDAAGREVDVVARPIGFRRVEVRGHELLVNGRAVLIKGVNRHDHDLGRGKAMTPEAIEADVVAMKRHNLNAVRTSHYPADTHLYDVCDRLGMYVLDEANLESHAYLRSLTKDPVWTPAILERITRMAQRDAGHPSVIMWSLGNESGTAPALTAAAAWLRAWDPSRPVHYESGITEDRLSGTAADMPAALARPRPESDVIAPMYPSVDDIVAWATHAPPDRPLVMCEYLHAMGNSCGGAQAYWDAIRAHPGLQGGFVWDWADQALRQRLDDGSERLAYGGDFGDEPNDGPFCINGLVAADRTPHPSLLELAKVVQPVQVEAVDAARGVLAVTNEHAFVDLGWLEPSWALHVDGQEVAAGRFEPLDLGPGERTEVRVPVPVPELGAGQRAHLTLSFRTREDRLWAPAGHEVAWEQVEVARAPGPSHAPGPRPEQPADLDRLEPTLVLWRAPIDNETFGYGHARRWEQLGLRDATGIARLHTDVGPADRPGAGRGVLVTHTVEVPDHVGDIGRVGVRLHVGPGAAGVEWLGRGPHECYPDRRASGRVGRWLTPIEAWGVPYVHPQANGNRTEVRWLRILDADGRPLLVVDELDDLDVTVARVTDAELADAAHLEELPLRDDCWVWIDARHRGVGSGAVGPDVAPECGVHPGTHRWSYRLA